MRLPERPQWLEDAIQGLAFWIGHRRAMFRYHPLSEGALVAELCNLIQVNLGDQECLHPEVPYSRITGGHLPGGIPTRARADLVLLRGFRDEIPRADDLSDRAVAAVEVKRGTAGKALIDEDLRRLSLARSANPNMRAFLVIASEARQPGRFVSNGKSRLGKTPVPNSPEWHYRVRRTCKAAASFSALKAQHYVCMLEIFRD